MRNTTVLLLLLTAFATAAQAQQASIHFLSREQARAALTQGAERGYYARLQLAEMRAKTGLPLQNLTLQVARDQVREAYGAAAEDISPEEQAALRAAIEALQPILQARAPLYARTPWTFIKVSQNIEGGLPHTRGDSIVLSDAIMAAIARAHARKSERPTRLWNLLVHEQTHVLQRHNPALFAPLYTEAFGFRQVALEPPPEWLRVRRVINPDAPDADWVFPVGDGAARRWVLPDLVLENLESPRMPQDFSIVALAMTQGGALWRYVDKSQPAALQSLSGLEDYVRAFPEHQELFHPNEICAVMLAELISGDSVQQPEHALWAKTREWAERALR